MKDTVLRVFLLATILLAATHANSQVQVWPGDANNDGVVNTLDVLYLGLGYNTQGPARNVQGAVWQPTQASPWNDILPDSLNYAYLDCDGSGFVDDSDLVVIQQNFDSIHGQLVVDSFPQPDSLSPVFYFTGLPDSVHAGDTVTINITAGNNIIAAQFFGIALTFTYDTTLVVSNSISAMPDTVLNSPVDRVLFFTAANSSLGTFQLALSRRANTGGNTGTPILLAGQNLATISFIIEDNLIGKAVAGPLVLRISDIKMVSKSLVRSSGHPTQVSLPFADKVAGISSPLMKNIRIYPQPASSMLMIDGLPENGNIIMTDLTGRTMVSMAIEAGVANSIDCAHLASGLYLLHIETINGSIVKKILID